SGRDAGQLVSDEELEASAGYQRAHAAELEEEGRRHASGEAEAEKWRDVDHEEDDRKVQRFAFDDERKRRDQRQQSDDEDTEDAEAANAAAKAAKERGLVNEDGAGRYFQDLPEDRLGDPKLTHPDEMQRILGPSVRFAQHAMVLAQAQLDAGTDRADALSFLANIYVQAKDRAYANKALREFGPATGILDIYPLELIDHLLEFVPGFCHRICRQGFLTSSTAAGYRAKVGQTIELTYDPKLRVRGFAIKDGVRPGYLFEPIDPPGSYHLTFLSPGAFTAMVSAISKDGQLWLETFPCRIAEGRADAAALLGLQRERDFHRSAEPGETAGRPATSKPKKAPDDLKIHFPRRI
ncbi:MAG: hypothetical protein AAF449_13040, partial [Myxococcota bacterium]